jgi:hypothetical protein
VGPRACLDPYRDSNPCSSVVQPVASRYTDYAIPEGQVPYLYSPGTGWPGYTPRHWVPFSSPPTTPRATDPTENTFFCCQERAFIGPLPSNGCNVTVFLRTSVKLKGCFTHLADRNTSIYLFLFFWGQLLMPTVCACTKPSPPRHSKNHISSQHALSLI